MRIFFLFSPTFLKLLIIRLSPKNSIAALIERNLIGIIINSEIQCCNSKDQSEETIEHKTDQFKATDRYEFE